LPLLNVTLVPAHYQVVVRLTGEADMSTAPLIADALQQAAGLGTRQVIVDVAGARFWDCSCLHALSVFTADLADAGRSCRIVGASPRTRRLVTLARFADELQLDGPVGPRPAPAVEEPAAARVGAPARRRTSGHPVPVRSRRAPALALRRGPA
jgi:anti-anti-sigma factor